MTEVQQKGPTVGTDAAAADPFADTPGGDPFTDTPQNATATAPPADEQPPVVDREGAPVNQGESDEGAAQAEAAPPEPQNALQDAPAPPQDAAPAAPPAEAEPQPAEAGDGGTPPEPPAAPPATDEPGLPEGTQASATSAAVQPAATEQAPAVEAPKEGKSPWRHYTLLYQTGPKQWTEYDLSTITDPNLKAYTELKAVDDKKPDDEKALFLKARNSDHARRLAWIIFGRPDAGVTVNPVARSSWAPKRLSAAPPAPSRERLVIS